MQACLWMFPLVCGARTSAVPDLRPSCRANLGVAGVCGMRKKVYMFMWCVGVGVGVGVDVGVDVGVSVGVAWVWVKKVLHLACSHFVRACTCIAKSYARISALDKLL